ncbi:hypothetical protein LMH87_000635 [Akanthomyces muscarius]|uniref:Uncharacterized protein n=1 Tax=Akanthomyces muscarius TaxID=2231603 RepID=A0A9W8QH78_AKAMU|nr:hypothetical protein LMH87_000635 [Akanthomyces muscarius]KAJ4155387.1 hypothetical protein LMH87_000635 [Akanthomyces muscarius]
MPDLCSKGCVLFAAGDGRGRREKGTSVYIRRPPILWQTDFHSGAHLIFIIFSEPSSTSSFFFLISATCTRFEPSSA